MKRDMELVIRILKVIEEYYTSRSFSLGLEDEGYEDVIVQYHLRIMTEAGLIIIDDVSTLADGKYYINGMTWYGHDFLDSARNEKVLTAAKEKAESKGFDFKSLPIDIIKELLTEGVKNLLECNVTK
ncbi:Hypothetical protein SAMN04487970_106133 [Paenibacillus tianmuensis]|uniref:DUF2513 domain-containing protein n=1 Tax=Paenibacillus tianmuensis TaxID=624147 RepID=A0A1G4TQ41_9BACL|nr:DUF2513 domain-containing protein [Paenibacillus tianmuensis]SCW83492.1 Hypothetical protein SAMN04487970_106133 [Paenibacillus tianmuensis]